MDDVKRFAQNDQQLHGLLTTVNQFSDNTRMQFGLDEWAKTIPIKGKMRETSKFSFDQNGVIKKLDPMESHKYLGLVEGDEIKHSVMRERIRKECCRRIRPMPRTESNARSRVFTYSFNNINWTINDRRILKLFTMHRIHHPKANIGRLYLPRKEVDDGFSQLELTVKIASVVLDTSLKNSNYSMLKLV